MASERVCRWGILGTAGIARKNWKAIRYARNATLTAVASRDENRARQFILECQSEAPFDPAPQAVGSYEELIASEAVDAVYIPLPTGIRKEWVLRAADSGKHVLAEKPAGGTADEIEEILASCRRKDVQYMDGVMFMHSPRLRRMGDVLDEGESVGTIKRIESQFTFGAPDEFFQQNIRAHSDLEPLGCLGDLGWYNLRFSLWAMNWRMPERVSGRILSEAARDDSPQSVPTEFSGELFWPGGVSATFYCSFLVHHSQWATVSGSKGFLHLPDFVLPFFGAETTFTVTNSVFHVAGCDMNMEEHTRRFQVPEYGNSAVNAQETHMIERFSELALSGSPDSFWGEVALNTQRVLDACLRSARSGGELVELTT